MTGVLVESLRKSYGDVTALTGLTFAAERSTMFGLIGPDGAGKTTFMKIAVSLLLQDSGRVTVGGFDTLKAPSKVKGVVGYMPQDFGQYYDLSVLENLVFFANLFGLSKREREERIERLLDFSKLKPFVNRRAGNLSGGMKRKLALSCTLIHTPAVLILDEPTTGVDPVSRREFWEILAGAKAGGTTIVVSTPYMDEAERCDRVGFIMNGAIIAEGTPREIPDYYTKKLLMVRGENIVRLTRKLHFPSVVRDVRTFGDRLHLTVDNAHESEKPVRDFLAGHGIVDIIIQSVKASMEDVFVENMSHGK